MYATSEKGPIELQVTSKEDQVEVIFKQGGEERFYQISDKLFLETKLPSQLRSLHAVIECLRQEANFEFDPSQPRRKEINRFLSFLSRSPHQEFRQLGLSLSRFFLDDQTLLVIIFTLTLIIIIALAIFYLK